jgi:hypothetical protein
MKRRWLPRIGWRSNYRNFEQEQRVQTQPLESVFSRSWQLLTRNWIIIVPGIVIGLIVGVVSDLLVPPQTYGDPSTTSGTVAHSLAGIVSSSIVSVVSIAGFVITQCYTVGMAGAAWARGRTTIGDGASALREDAGHVFVAAIGLFLLGVVAVILIPFTLFLSLFIYYLFMLYAIPAAVVGNLPGMKAIGESVAIARAKFGTTLLIGIVLGAIALLGNVIALVFAFAPLLGPIISAVISEIVVAFSSLVLVGEYLNLRGTTTPRPPVY